jgi:hypothetical protein
VSYHTCMHPRTHTHTHYPYMHARTHARTMHARTYRAIIYTPIYTCIHAEVEIVDPDELRDAEAPAAKKARESDLQDFDKA